MAWGMFLSIPCPKKIWDEKARPQMLMCMPIVGVIIGVIWAVFAYLFSFILVPAPIYAIILTAIPLILTGFMHLDGFMDVCDAILSRRDIETKRKILKDPNCGAFSVICLVLLLMAEWSIFFSAENLSYISIALIPIAVRAAAALAVGLISPMEQSQYAKMERIPRGAKAFLVIVLLVSCAAGIFFGISGFAPLAAVLMYMIAVFGAKRSLGGMSGDVSGFALTLGEACGILFSALGGMI